MGSDKFRFFHIEKIAYELIALWANRFFIGLYRANVRNPGDLLEIVSRFIVDSGQWLSYLGLLVLRFFIQEVRRSAVFPCEIVEINAI